MFGCTAVYLYAILLLIYVSPLSVSLPARISLRLVASLHIGKDTFKYVFLPHYSSSVYFKSSKAITKFARMNNTCVHRKPLLWSLNLHNCRARLMSTRLATNLMRDRPTWTCPCMACVALHHSHFLIYIIMSVSGIIVLVMGLFSKMGMVAATGLYVCVCLAEEYSRWRIFSISILPVWMRHK